MKRILLICSVLVIGTPALADQATDPGAVTAAEARSTAHQTRQDTAAGELPEPMSVAMAMAGLLAAAVTRRRSR